MKQSRFRRALVLDWETTGLNDERNPPPDYFHGAQGIEIGAVVVDNLYDQWTVVGEFHRRIRYVGPHDGNPGQYPNLIWSEKAYQVHGLSIGDLQKESEPAVVGRQFVTFLQIMFGREPILICGHNPAFDRYFSQQLLAFADSLVNNDIRFHHRMLDSNTLGLFLWGAQSSDELFQIALGRTRGKHSGIEDARLTTEIFRRAVQKLGGIPIPQD